MLNLLQTALSVFLITLGLGQILSTWQGLRALSLVGPGRLAGYMAGAVLLAAGAFLLPQSWAALGWAILAGPLALGLLLLAGSYVAPPPHPDRLFGPNYPGHGGCQAVEIPDGHSLMPGLLLFPRPETLKDGPAGLAVCLVPGAGNTKISYKWRLVQSLLDEGLTVLTFDTPGHGEYRHRPMAFPDCLSVVPAAICFLRQQPGIDRVGLIGLSLGGALATRSLVEHPKTAGQVDALVILETPVNLKLDRGLVRLEFWRTISRAPVLSLFQEISLNQIRRSWRTGGYRSRHSSTELIDLLDPPASLARLNKDIPILLVYSQGDPIAPPAALRAMRQAAPQAAVIDTKKASHVTLTLIPTVNRQITRWLKQQLSPETRPVNLPASYR